MNSKMKNWCRMCGMENAILIDFLVEDSKEHHKLFMDLTHISIDTASKLPTKVCLACDEKMLTLQMFLTQCKEVQTYLNQLILTQDVDKACSVVKTEVKEEMTEDFLLDVIDNKQTDFKPLDEDINNDFSAENNSESEKSFEVKKKKRKTKKSYRFSDYVIMECELCKMKVRNWEHLETHYKTKHSKEDSKPILSCMCGYYLLSKSSLYRHVSEHRKDGNEPSKAKVKDYFSFNCRVCEKECFNWSTLCRHSERKHGVKGLTLCNCGVMVTSHSGLYKHLNTHNNTSEVFRCEQCEKTLSSQEALEKHKVKHNRLFKCDSCSKIFKTIYLLKSHLKSHIPITERRCHQCDACGQKFTTRQAMLAHNKYVHENIRPFVCDVCGFSCGTNGELKQHRATHSDSKPFVCEKCNKGFKTYSNLKTHMDIHNDTSYSCFLCNRVLNSKRTLRKHLLVHQDECKHVCSYCNKAFKRRSTLKVHLSSHTGDKPISCPWCSEKFKYSSSLRSHKIRYHPDKLNHKIGVDITTYME